MRQLSTTVRAGHRIAVIVLAVWLASGCNGDSIRLGGWTQTAAEPVANPAPPPSPPPPPSAVPAPEVGKPGTAAALLQSRCYPCHQYGARDPSGWGSVGDVSRMIDTQIIVPGDMEHSRLWHRVAVRNDMPFNGQRLTPEEKAMLQNWILEMKRPLLRLRTPAQMLDLLIQDQAAADGGSDTRYVSFAHFVDAGRTAEEVRAAGDVLKVVLNSLSRRPAIVNPVAVDAEGSVWRFRLSDLGWSERDWRRIVSFYPYCLRSDSAPHLDLYRRLRTEAPIVRGDWFVSTALAPPLYYELLGLDDNLDDIARSQLGIDIDQDIAEGKVQRMAKNFTGVFVSAAVFERHEANGGGYLWLTYRLGEGEDIRRSPLGPRNRNRDFPSRSFSTQATEALWSLPNGLQAYVVADPDGNRTDAVPTVLVQDPRSKRGQAETSLSCNGCHSLRGLLPAGMLVDIGSYVERPGTDFNPAEIERVRQIYVNNGDQILAADAAHYRDRIGGLLGQRLPGPGVMEWDDFNTLRGQYESKVGFRQGVVELGSDLTAAQWQASGDAAQLPLKVTDALLMRDEWICSFRRIAPRVHRASFCGDTFTAVELHLPCTR